MATIKALEARIEALEAALRAISPAAARRYLDGILPQPHPISAAPKTMPKIMVGEPTAQTSEREVAALNAGLRGDARFQPVKPLF